jgi:hypothetical protein
VEDNANTSVSDFLQILVQILTVVAVPEKLDKISYVVFAQLITGLRRLYTPSPA